MPDDSKFYVYMAGPLYGSGTTGGNIRKMVKLADMARCCGLVPFLPHLYYFQDLILPREREYWMDLDLDWVRRCDALVLLTGPSPGSEQERALAVELELPIVPIDWESGPGGWQHELLELLAQLEAGKSQFCKCPPIRWVAPSAMNTCLKCGLAIGEPRA